MATYSYLLSTGQNANANDTAYEWAAVLSGTVVSVTTTDIILQNSDGTTTDLGGVFTVNNGTLAGGTITTAQHKSGPNVIEVPKPFSQCRIVSG